MIQKWSQNPSKITPKFDAEKRLEKRFSGIYIPAPKPAPGAMRGVPKGYHFKRILRKKTEKKAN